MLKTLFYNKILQFFLVFIIIKNNCTFIKVYFIGIHYLYIAVIFITIYNKYVNYYYLKIYIIFIIIFDNCI